jgi:MYXO-CTERM domain-containing protein
MTALGVALPAVAAAAPLRARVSEKGLTWLEGQVAGFLPTEITPPEIAVKMFDCSGGQPARFVQKNTRVGLKIENVDVALPIPGVVRLDLTLSVSAQGEAHLEKIYSCGLSAKCNDHVQAEHFRAIVDFSASVDAAGKPHLKLEWVDLQLDEQDLEIQLSGNECPGAELINTVVGFAKKYGLQMGLLLVESMAVEKVQPILEEVLAGFTGVDQTVGPLEIKAALSSLTIGDGGIEVEADVDLWSKFPAAVCVAEQASLLPTEPQTKQGADPLMSGGVETDVSVAVNLGLIDDALFQVWREGMMCMSPSTLEAFGIHVPLEEIGVMLPGFPAGTTFSFEARVAKPPRVEGLSDANAKVKVVMSEVEASLLATLPDHSTRTLDISLDAEMVAEVRVDNSVNALALRVERANVTRIYAEDHFGLEERGFDLAHVKQIAETVLLPKVFGEMGEMPVTGPVFGGILDTYVLLREIRTNDAWITAKLDLFRAPKDDTGAPDTVLESRPDGVVNPHAAKLTVGGTDALVPTELLRYVVTVDGTVLDPSYVRAIKVGEVGKTKKYQVQIAAMDLAGNVDPTPESLEIDVDGIAPRLSIVNPFYGEIGTTRPELQWSATDDRSAAGKIKGRIELARATIVDGKSVIAPMEEIELGAGKNSHQLPRLEPGGSYQVTLFVADEAGNEIGDAMLFTVSTDADDGGGCSVTAGGTSTPASLVLFLGLGLALAFVRRRR